jgi:hypothetical protein
MHRTVLLIITVSIPKHHLRVTYCKEHTQLIICALIDTKTVLDVRFFAG